MGVTASYCQICGIPVQQDHYIPQDGMLAIYRGEAPSADDDCKPVVAFGREHVWLKRAVAVAVRAGQDPAVVHGEIHDGYIDNPTIRDGMVWEGFDERAALHEACWELAGKPERWTREWRIDGSELEPYCEQLFEFEKLVEDGRAWMIVDPRFDSADAQKNRTRIVELLGIARA
ncbi:MAG TPA: hypothetical protein VIU61_13460 [Kofleriaceae bacterium]